MNDDLSGLMLPSPRSAALRREQMTASPDPALRRLLDAGRRHHAAGWLDKAQERYRAALRRDGCNPDALHLLGLAVAQSGRVDAGTDFIRMAIDVGPAPERHADLGGLPRGQGRLEEAVAAWRDALDPRPDWPEPWYNLPNALLELGRGA